MAKKKNTWQFNKKQKKHGIMLELMPTRLNHIKKSIQYPSRCFREGIQFYCVFLKYTHHNTHKNAFFFLLLFWVVVGIGFLTFQHYISSNTQFSYFCLDWYLLQYTNKIEKKSWRRVVCGNNKITKFILSKNISKDI